MNYPLKKSVLFCFGVTLGTQELLLAQSGNSPGGAWVTIWDVGVSNLDWLHANQMPYLLSYCSSPKKSILYEFRRKPNSFLSKKKK